MKIVLVLIILNNTVFGKLLTDQRQTIQGYAKEMGIEIQIKTKNVYDTRCRKFNKLNSFDSYLSCLEKRYARDKKKGRYYHFISPSTKQGENFGYARLCVADSDEKRRASVSSYNIFSRFYSVVAPVHEVLHQLCVSHEDNSFNLMNIDAGNMAEEKKTLPPVSQNTLDELQEIVNSGLYF